MFAPAILHFCVVRFSCLSRPSSIFRSILEISSCNASGPSRQAPPCERFEGMREPNVGAATRRTRSTASNLRAFGDPGGRLPPGRPRNLRKCIPTAEEERDNREIRNVAGRRRARTHLLFFNFFPSCRVSELALVVHLLVLLDRKRDMSYTEPLWEINGNQAPVSPSRVLYRARCDFTVSPNVCDKKKKKVNYTALMVFVNILNY